MKRKLIIIRGLPGSGKSTLAQKLVSEQSNIKHFEADMFFMKNGEYVFDRDKLNGAHKWCYQQTLLALIHGFDVVVSNTFTTKKELAPYLEIGAANTVDIEIIEMKDNYGSIHGVPQETIIKMKERWQTL